MTLNYIISLILNVILALVPCFVMLLIPYRHRLRIKTPAIILLSVSYTTLAIYSSLHIIDPLATASTQNPISAIFFFFISLGLSLLVIKDDPLQILFVVGIMGCYIDNVDFLVKAGQALLPWIDPMLPHQTTYLIGHIIVLAITFPIMFRILRNWMIPLFAVSNKSTFWRYLWLIPALFYLLYHLAIKRQLFELHALGKTSHLIALPILWVVLTLLVIYTVMKLVVETERSTRKEQELKFADDMLEIQSHQQIQQQKSMETIQHLKHDFRHELIVLKEYVKEQRPDCIEKYIEQTLGTLEDDDLSQYTKNAPVNSILRYFIGMARKHDIEVSTFIDLPEILPILENDYCMLLSNIMENAIEACQRQQTGNRFIDIKAATAGDNMLTLTITNSYDGEIVRQGDRFRSSKRHANGIGTVSIQNIANRYDGITKFDYNGETFSTSVFLNPQNVN